MSRRRGRDHDWQSRRGGWAEQQDPWVRHLADELHKQAKAEVDVPLATHVADDELRTLRRVNTP